MLEASFRPVNCSIRSDVVGHEIKPTDARPPSRGGRTRGSRSRRIALPIISLREACLALLASNTENILLFHPLNLFERDVILASVHERAGIRGTLVITNRSKATPRDATYLNPFARFPFE